MSATQIGDIQKFYDLLGELGDKLGGPRKLKDCAASSGWPTHGVYFFFEDDETWVNGLPRVVRIGTHALTATSKTKLWDRLSSHRGIVAGSRAGGGNHRSSIFRLHVGTALLAQNEWPSDVRSSWRDSNAGYSARLAEHSLEQSVTQQIGAMPFLWLAVPHREDRGVIERNSIALLSCRRSNANSSSPQWLGLRADNEKVRTSALWNVNHVDDEYDPRFLSIFSKLVKNA